MAKSNTKKEYNEMRKKGVKALGTLLKEEKNISIIEKYVYKQVEKIPIEEEQQSEYNYILFQIVGDIIKGKKLRDIVKNVKKSMIGWNHEDFNNIKYLIEEQDEFIINPFEVEEGVTKCNKCGSERVFTYSKQVRSADEPMSTFAKCVKCKQQWTYSG